MADLLTLVAASAAAIAAWVRFQSIRPASPTRAQRCLLVALCAVALSLALTIPGVRVLLASIGPVPYAIQLVSNGLGMLASYSMIVMMMCLSAGSDQSTARWQQRRHVSVMCLTLLVIGVCLASSDADIDRDLMAAAVDSVDVMVSQIVYSVFLAACVARFVLLVCRSASVPEPRPQMRCSVSLVVVAGLVAMVSILGNIVAWVAMRTDRPVAEAVAAFSQLLNAGAVTLLAVGVALTVVRTWHVRLIRWCRVRLALRGITPLWRELTTIVPEVALPQFTAGGQPGVVLYRQVIEIRDAELVLLRYVPSEVDGEVLLAAPRPRRASHVAVRAEAIALATGMDRYLAGHDHPATPISAHHVSIATSDLLAEARWLIRVHRAIRTDPTVAQIRGALISNTST